jgi:CoA:oxalate CoA-transferase
VRQGNRIMRVSPFNSYPTRDGAIVAGAATTQDWLRLLAVIGREDLSAKPNYMDSGWRVTNNAHIDEIVAGWTRTHTKADVLAKLDAQDIPCSPINEIADVLAWQHLQERAMVQPLQHPSLSTARTALAPDVPLKFSGAQVGYLQASMPRAHNDEIYIGLLNLLPAELEELAKDGII